MDISEPMLAHGQIRAESTPNLTFELADAAVAEFNSQYDLLFSRFGVMFFSDPEAAFENLRKALKTTGRMVFVCWLVGCPVLRFGCILEVFRIFGLTFERLWRSLGRSWEPLC